jgi:hypothetical protein
MKTSSPRGSTSPRASRAGSKSPGGREIVRHAAAETTQKLTAGSGLASVDDWVKVPRSAASQHILKVEMDMQQQSCEKILCDEMILLKKMLLKHQASSMNFDDDMVDDFVDTRAQQAIDEELGVLIRDLVQVKGTHPHHRMTAYAQVFASLNADLKTLVFTEDRQKVVDLQAKLKMQQEAFRADSSSLSYTVATRDREIEILRAEKAELQEKCDAAAAEALHWKRELEKTGRSQEQAHQDMVELRMQGIDFKSEINRRSLKVLHSIQSRMGFVPSGVQKQILLLNMLKAPGDPAYDEVRRTKATDRDKFLSSTFTLPAPGLGAGLQSGFAPQPPISFIDLIGKKLVEGGVDASELNSPRSGSNSRSGSPGRPPPSAFPRSMSQSSTASADTSCANDSRRRSSTSSTTDTRRSSTSSIPDTLRSTVSVATSEDTTVRTRFVSGGENLADFTQQNRTEDASPEQELMHNSFGELEDDDEEDDDVDNSGLPYFTNEDYEAISSDINTDYPPRRTGSEAARVSVAGSFVRKPVTIVVNNPARSDRNLLVKSAVPKQKKRAGPKKKNTQQQVILEALSKPKERFVAGQTSASFSGAPLPLPPRTKPHGGNTSPPLGVTTHGARGGSAASPYRVRSSPRNK